MTSVGREGGFDIKVGSDALTPTLMSLISALKYSPRFREISVSGDVARAYLSRCECSPDEDERKVAEEPISSSSLHFKPTRDLVRASLRAIVAYIFDSHGLPKSNGLDIGCGATGEMAEKLLPDDIDTGSWAQCDINPDAVKLVQDSDPRVRPFLLSYLNLGLEKNPLNIVTGLSCLDSTCNVQRAVEQVRDSLVKGGYFLHIQDVRHKSFFAIERLLKAGAPPPYKFIGLNSYPKGDYADFMYKNGDGALTPSVEFFRQYLAEKVRDTVGMKIVFDDWICAERTAPSNENPYSYMNGLYCGHERASGQRLPGADHLGRPSSEFQRTSVAVMLARKV